MQNLEYITRPWGVYILISFSIKDISVKNFEKQKFNSDITEPTTKIIFQLNSLFNSPNKNKNIKAYLLIPCSHIFCQFH